VVAATFVRELASAIVAALQRNERRLAGKALDCLAIDVHPWSGFINLSARPAGDRHPRRSERGVPLADWELAHFAVAHETSRSSAWPEARDLAARMEREYAGSADEAAAARRFRELVMAAASRPAVWRALGALSLGPDFCILVPNFDSQEDVGEVRGPARAKKTRRTRRSAR
jgi:hypothetical protein